MRKYNVNEDFFSEINNEESAYWLGFLFADGYVRSNKLKFVRLKLAIKDIDHLYKFKEALNSDHNVEEYDSYCQITIGSKKIVDDLIKNGCTPNKGMKIRLPNNIGSDLMNHFIRGYFDGDGCISHRGCNSYVSSIISNTNFSTDVRNLLGYGYLYSDSKNRNLANLTFNKDCLRFRDYIYKNAKVYLKRKFDGFKEMDYIKESKVWLPNKYKVTNLTSNESQIVDNLSKFCSEHNLSKSGMCKVSSGKYKSHRGFICEKL
jgi:hypothetical protein